jgi:hypothetical protein
MGTCYSSYVTKSCVKPKKKINKEKSIQEICMDAAEYGNLYTIKSAHEKGELNDLELQEVFCHSVKHGNLNIIEYGFEIKILKNMENILHIASLYSYSIIIEYLIFNYQYDNINIIYNTFIISAFNGDDYIIKLLSNKYEINDITYIIAYLAAYKNNWGTCTQFISNKINKRYFNKIIEYNFDLFNLNKEIENLFNIFYKKINKNSKVNRPIKYYFSTPIDIIPVYHTRYPSTKDSEEDVYNIFISCLKILMDNGYTFNEDVCTNAAENDNLEILKIISFK